MIGKSVTVIVDRPLSSYHPEHKDMYYPINYGYVEGIMAADIVGQLSRQIFMPFIMNLVNVCSVCEHTIPFIA